MDKELWEIGIFKDIEDSKTAFLELQTKGYIRYKDLPLQTKENHIIYVEFVSNVYGVGDQKVIQCNIRDITDQKNAEDKLIEEKTKDEAILASIGDGVIVTDHESKIILINSATEALLGWKSIELLGKKLFDTFQVEDAKGNKISDSERPTQIALTTGKKISSTITTTNYYYIKKDGTKLPVAITVTPVILNNEIVGVVDIFRDITHEEAIDKSKNEFISIASHQLKTPLGITKWYLEVLQKDEYINNSPKNIKDYFDVIFKNNERVLSLVRQLLLVSRIDQGRIKNVPLAMNVVEVVSEIIDELQLLAQKKDIKLSLEIKEPNLPNLYIDHLRFHEVVVNLVANAIEYTPSLGIVTITLDKKDTDLVIIVKDTGMGINSDEQKKLFTKFFRSESAVAQNPDGTGLGLYVVKSYIDEWGGNISVESEAGKGTTFTINLPVSQDNNKDPKK